MKTTYSSLTIILLLTFLPSCKDPCVGCGSTPPPPQVISIGIFYKTNNNEDLLNEYAPNHFKKSDLKVTSKMIANGITKEINYNDSGIEIYLDNDLRKNCFDLLVPTSYEKTPIATYVQLSPTLVDTVTYTYNSAERKYMPDQIFYNNKLVWEVANAPQNGRWPPIIVIK